MTRIDQALLTLKSNTQTNADDTSRHSQKHILISQACGFHSFLYDVPEDFQLCKRQMLKLLNYIYTINPKDFQIFKDYKDNIEKNLIEQSHPDDIFFTLNIVKGVLENSIVDICKNPKLIDPLELASYEVSACLSAAGAHMVTITERFSGTKLQSKIQAAKKGVLLALAEEFIAQNSLLLIEGGQLLIGEEVHWAHGLFNLIAEKYGLPKIIDKLIPNESFNHQDSFTNFITEHFNYLKIVDLFMIQNPPPSEDNITTYKINQFLTSIDATDGDLFRLYDFDSKNRLFPKENFDKHYALLILEQCRTRGWIQNFYHKIDDKNLVLLSSCIIEVDKDDDDNIRIKPLPLTGQNPYEIKNFSKLVELADYELFYFQQDPNYIYHAIMSLEYKFSEKLTKNILKQKLLANHDQLLASIVTKSINQGFLPKNTDTLTPLYNLALAQGHEAVLQSIFLADPFGDNKQKNIDNSLLVSASRGNLKFIRFFLLKGANINFTLENGMTALMHATRGGHHLAANFLLLLKADVNCKSHHYQETALHIAAIYGHSNIIDALLNHHPELDPKDYLDATPLYYAAQNNHLEAAKQLLANGAKVNATVINGDSSVLLTAVRRGLNDMIDLLLSHDADISHSGANGNALFLAVQNGNVAIIETLLAHNTASNKIDYLKKKIIISPTDMDKVEASLSQLPQKHQKNTARFWQLLRNNLRLNETDNIPNEICGFSTLHMAIILGHKEIVELLENALPVPDFNNYGFPLSTNYLKRIFLPELMNNQTPIVGRNTAGLFHANDPGADAAAYVYGEQPVNGM